MSKPGTRFFIGPLTPAQQRRRERARENFRRADEIAYARNIDMSDAFKAATDRWYGIPLVTWTGSDGREP
jgi:hypothetical protein